MVVDHGFDSDANEKLRFKVKKTRKKNDILIIGKGQGIGGKMIGSLNFSF
jgi:hypothetical protein